MIKWFNLIILSICYQFVMAQYPGYTQVGQTEIFKNAFAQATAATETIQSDFRQEKSLTMLSEKIISTGKFWYRKTDKLRMEYLHPYTYLMILNAGKIYIKEGQKESRISTASGRIFKQVNRILIDCVAGRVLDNPDFQSRIFENKTMFLIELIPLARNLKSLYKNINIVIDKKDDTASAIEMYEVSGDYTIIRFQNKILNAQIPDSVFNTP